MIFFNCLEFYLVLRENYSSMIKFDEKCFYRYMKKKS